MKHLTDNEIQSYFQEYQTDERSRWEQHLSECPECKKQLLLYRQLQNIVCSTLVDDTPKAFEETVMTRLALVQRTKRTIDLTVAAVTSVGLAVIALIFILTPQLKQVFSNFMIETQKYTGVFIGEKVITTETISVLSFAIIIYVIFSLLDRLAIGKYTRR